MSYFVRSIVTFLALFGLVAFVADRAYFNIGLSVSLGMQIALAILLLQYLVAPAFIRWALAIDWNTGLPARNQEFLRQLCEREGLPMPKVGIVHGSMPNAFTFGRMQSDASIVVTTGLLESLTPEEANAVIAHEAGHIKHYDFLTMTLAAMAPLLLYQLYVLVRRLRDDEISAWFAYAVYWLSELIVLSLSRTREYWADQFAAQATGDASLLSTALVKICYGMAKVDQEGKWAQKHGNAEQKKAAAARAHLAGRIGVLGISTAEAKFALSGGSHGASAALMRWDLENPWARVYQLLSTHPLTALRVKALNEFGIRHQGRTEAAVPLPVNTRIRWGNFPVELALWAAPWLATLVLLGTLPLAKPALHFALAMLAAGLWIGRIAYRYQGRFTPATVRELAEDVTPSNMLPRAVELECEVMGRGEAEAFWSPDLVVKDDTGIVFMLDRQSIPLARFFRAQHVEKLFGQRVVLRGWYRRGPSPFIEMSSLEVAGAPVYRSYSRWIQMGWAVAGCTLAWLIAG